jgi:hypothetical protein
MDMAAAKSKHKRRSYLGKAARQSKFSKRMESWAEEVEESFERLGKKIECEFDSEFSSHPFNKHVKRTVHVQNRHYGPCWEHRWYGTVGIIAPFIASVFSIGLLALFALAFQFFDFGVQSGFFHAISSFFLSNISLFFAVSLFFQYAKYAEYLFPKVYRLAGPLVDAAGAVWAAWILMSILLLVDIYWPSQLFMQAAVFIFGNFPAIFMLFAILGYLALPYRHRCCCNCEHEKQ